MKKSRKSQAHGEMKEEVKEEDQGRANGVEERMKVLVKEEEEGRIWNKGGKD